MIQLVGDAAREQRQREKADAQYITVGEAKSLCVDIIEHYMRQMPELIVSLMDAREKAKKEYNAQPLGLADCMVSVEQAEPTESEGAE